MKELLLGELVFSVLRSSALEENLGSFLSYNFFFFYSWSSFGDLFETLDSMILCYLG